VKDYITTTEAAAIIGVNPKAVAKAIRKGRVEAREGHNRWEVLRSSAEAYASSVGRIRVRAEPERVQERPIVCKVSADEGDNWLLRAVSLMTPEEARAFAKRVLEATVQDPAARLLIERHI
jgi:hypothetical protein